MQPLRQAHFIQQMCRPCRVVLAAGEAHTQQHVLQRGEAGEEMMRLEDVADVLAAEDIALGFGELRDIDAAIGPGLHARAAVGERRAAGIGFAIGRRSEEDFARVGREDAGDHVEQRGFARSAGADERDLLAVGEGKMLDVDDGNDAAVGADELFAKLCECDGHGVEVTVFLRARECVVAPAMISRAAVCHDVANANKRFTALGTVPTKKGSRSKRGRAAADEGESGPLPGAGWPAREITASKTRRTAPGRRAMGRIRRPAPACAAWHRAGTSLRHDRRRRR